MNDDPLKPELIPLKDWRFHGLQLQGTCVCGRTSIVHRGELLNRFGPEAYVSGFKKDMIAASLRCIRCDRKGEITLTIVRG
jgi:hypothetical protein